MPGVWANLSLPAADFDAGALQDAIEARKAARGLTWQAVMLEINRAQQVRRARPISASTVTGLRAKRWGVEGDGVLQMLLWLDRSPESFVPGHPGAARPEARLPVVSLRQTLRFDVGALRSAVDADRQARGLTWDQVAREMGGGMITGRGLASMATGQRASFPWVMRMTRWVKAPAAAFTGAAAG